MELTNYHSSITACVSADQAYAGIANVGGWWARNFSGSAQNQGDTFTVQFGETKVAFGITEAIPGKKIVWQVTDCHLPWLKDTKEWKDTKVVWEISPENDATRIDMTHLGLVPGIECYEACEKGWNQYVTGSLLKLVSGGQGDPR